MLLQNTAKLNACHRTFYAAQQERTNYLLKRQYIVQFVQQNFVIRLTRAVEPFPIDAYQRLRFEPSFESQIIAYAKNPDADGASALKIRYAREPRRKAAGAGLSRRQIVEQFASSTGRTGMRTKSLWEPFFSELVRLGLNPSKHSDGGIYEYDGKRKRLPLTYRQFEKLVSDLAPRRINRRKA